MARTKNMAKKSKRGRPKGKSKNKGGRKNAPAKGGIIKNKRRWRPGTVAMREIKRY